MKISEILKIERNNVDSINLFKEGIFWCSYEKSAWRFVENIKEYRVFKKFVKVVNQDIVYLGFPDNVLNEILTNVETRHLSTPLRTGTAPQIIRKNDKFIEIKGFSNTEGFEQWKADFPVTDIKPASSSVKGNFNKNIHNEIIIKIKQYPIVNKTPVEAFNFLAEIQKELHGDL
jgi:hypothetical protein